jgi:alkylation response protein AidB-like acyl-CoA dehydrogenase
LVSEETLVMLEDAAASFAKFDARRVRRALATEDGFDREAWSKMAGLGWLSILAPEERGGLGLGVGGAVVIARQLGRSVYPEPFTASALVTVCLSECDNATIWQERLDKLSAGELLVSLAWQNHDGSVDIEEPGVMATDGAEVVLDGESRFVAVPTADAFIVLARAAEGLQLYWVARSQPGLTVQIETSADGSPSGRLRFERVRIEAGARLVKSDGVAPIVQRAIDAGLIIASAELLGVMDRTLDMTLDYLRARVQFDAPIGSFQVLQHRAVDMWIQRQLTWAALGAAVAVADDPAASAMERSAAASGVKARAAGSALFLCNQALQLHGAMGFADEYGLGLYLNRAFTLSAWLGNGAQHRRRFGELNSTGRIKRVPT